MANFKSINGEWFYIDKDGKMAEKSVQAGFKVPEEKQGVILPKPEIMNEAPVQITPEIETVDESLAPLPNPETILPVSEAAIIKPKKGGKSKKIVS